MPFTCCSSQICILMIWILFKDSLSLLSCLVPWGGLCTHFSMQTLWQLGKHKEALDFALSARCLSPSDPKLEERVQDIKQRLAAGI